MADFKKALHHHEKARGALRSGDAATAMHHVGHIMAALKRNGPADNQPTQDAPMPAVSKAQDRAMLAAKEGNSTLGIPQKVGAEFVSATPSTTDLPEKKNPVANLKKRLQGMKK